VTLRVRQACLTAALLGPLGFAVMTAPPFEATSRAAGPQRMVGPLFPVKVDSNGNGIPDARDESVGTTLAGSQLTVNSRWHCSTSNNNVVNFSNPDGSGHYQTVSRTNGPFTQTVNSGGGTTPTSFNWVESSTISRTNTGTMRLVDINGDGVVDQMMFIGTSINVSVGFAFSQNSQDISIPWSQASLLGLNTSDSCGGSDPQIWIPLADTNGDGLGDTIVFDLNGDGVADSQFATSPPLVPAAAPSMGVIARAILTLLLGATAAWFLARRGTPALTPQA
jgi:hypothetical protein